MCFASQQGLQEVDEAISPRAEVYGAEYRNGYKPQLYEHEVPCAVCAVTRRQVLMMPGTNLCDEGWTTEYVGQISATSSTHETHLRTEFVCMDDDPEITTHSSPDNDQGVLFYTAQVICGSLPCTLYVEDEDLLCVVCSR